jgi:hypothetical protein
MAEVADKMSDEMSDRWRMVGGRNRYVATDVATPTIFSDIERTKMDMMRAIERIKNDSEQL